MTHKELTIQALENMKGDDLHRAQSSFRGMNKKQLAEPHGQSGKTRAEVLADYQQHEDRVQAAIDWVRSK